MSTFSLVSFFSLACLIREDAAVVVVVVVVDVVDVDEGDCCAEIKFDATFTLVSLGFAPKDSPTFVTVDEACVVDTGSLKF